MLPFTPRSPEFSPPLKASFQVLHDFLISAFMLHGLPLLSTFVYAPRQRYLKIKYYEAPHFVTLSVPVLLPQFQFRYSHQIFFFPGIFNLYVLIDSKNTYGMDRFRLVARGTDGFPSLPHLEEPTAHSAFHANEYRKFPSRS